MTVALTFELSMTIPPGVAFGPVSLGASEVRAQKSVQQLAIREYTWVEKKKGGGGIKIAP